MEREKYDGEDIAVDGAMESQSLPRKAPIHAVLAEHYRTTHSRVPRSEEIREKIHSSATENMDLISDLVTDLKTIKDYQDEVEKERKDRELKEQTEISSLRDLSNLYHKAQTAQEEEWRSQNRENQAKASSLAKANQQMEEKMLRMEISLQKKREEAREADGEQKELHSRIDQLKLQQRTEIAALKHELKEANNCKSDFSRTLESLRSEKEKLSWNLKEGSERHRHESGELRNDLQEAKLEVASLEKRLKTVAGRENKMAEEVELKHKLTSELTSQILAMEEKSSQLSTDNRALEERLTKQERQWPLKLQKAEDEKSGLLAEKNKWEDRLRRKERAMQERLEDVESANSQLAMEKRKIEREASQKTVELETHIENIKAELVRANAKRDTSEQQMFAQEKHYRDQLENIEAELARATAKTEASEQMMFSQEKHYKEQLEESESRLCKAQSENDTLRLEMRSVRENADKKVQKLESDVANQRAERVQLVQSCDVKEPIIDEQKQKLEEQRTTIAMLQERTKSLEKQLSDTIVRKHDQLYQERKQMQQDEEENLGGLLEQNVAMETKIHQLQMELKEEQHRKESLGRRVAKQDEMLQKNHESSGSEGAVLRRDIQERTDQHQRLVLVNSELEERVEALEGTIDQLQDKLKKQDFSIKEVMVKNMDLRTDLKHARNKTSNEVVLCRSELRETKHRLREAEEQLAAMKHSEERLEAREAEEQEECTRKEERMLLDMQQYKDGNHHLKNVLEDYRNEKTQMTSKLEEATRRMEGALGERQRLEGELEERNRAWEREKGDAAQRHQREISDLMEKNAVSQGRLATLASHNITRLTTTDRSLVSQNEIRELQSKLESVMETNREMEEELRALRDGRDQNSIIQNENSILQAKLEDIEEENTQKVSELEEILTQARNARQGLEAEVGNLKDSQTRLRKEVKQLQGELDKKGGEFRAHIGKIEHENRALQSTLKESKGQSSSEVALLRLEVDTLDRESQKTNQARERAERDLKQIQQELETVKLASERYEQEIKRLKLEMENQEGEMLRETESEETAKQEMRRVKLELERVTRTNQELGQLKLTNEKCEQELEQMRGELERVKRTNERLEKEKRNNESQRKELRGRESELFQVNEARCLLDAEVDRLSAADALLRRQLDEQKKGHSEALTRLGGEVAQYKEDNKGLKVACESLQGQSSETAVLRSELDTMRRREGEKVRALSELTSAEQRLKKQLDDAEEKLSLETDRWQETVTGLEEQNLNLKEAIKGGDAVKEELKGVKGQLRSMKRNYDSLEDKEKATTRRLRAGEADLDRERDGHSVETRKLTLEIMKLKNEIASLTGENKSLVSERCAIQAKASDFTAVSKEREKVQTRAQMLENDLKQTSEVARDQEKTISNLQSMCSMFEEQVADLESLSERLEMNLQETLVRNEGLERQLTAEKGTQRKMTDELRADLEQTRTRVGDLEKREVDLAKIREEEKRAFEVASSQHDEEVEDLNRDIDHWRQQGQNYKDQALELAKQLGDLQTSYASMERELRSLKDGIIAKSKQSDHLSTELAGIVDRFEHTKATNFKLTSCLEKAIETGKELKGARDNLESEVSHLQSNYSVEKVKLRGMMTQQKKLLDFLQAKMEEPPKKKKKKLFGKSPKTKMDSTIIPLPYKELQDLLEYEQCKNAGLERCLDETRNELQALRSGTLKSQSAYSTSHLSLASDVSMASTISNTSTVLSAIVLSPCNQPSPDSLSTQAESRSNRGKRKEVCSQNPSASKRVKERMKHNIPHRFTNILNMKPTICAGCVGSVHFGRHATKCQECHRICHPKCASALPHTCGLPFQFVQHFSESLHHPMDSPVSALDSSTESSVMKYQGWMKVQRSVKQGWEKKWVILDGTQLLIFNREHVKESSRPLKTFDLQPKEGRVSLHPSVISTELPNTVPSDLPFVIKLEHHASSQPYFPSAEGPLYLMAPTYQEKRTLVGALENIVTLSGMAMRRQSTSVIANTLLSLEGENKLDINSTMILDRELLLVGCDEGLYVMSLEKLKGPLSQLLGVGSMYQLKHIPQLGIVVIIAGELRKLGFIEVPHLITQAQEAGKKDTRVKCTSIASLEACHLFAVEEINNTTYLCAAQAQKISIFRYDTDKFVLKKEIPTTEPCSCLIFSQTGMLIAGMDRFYKVDLRTFQAGEFLDSSDASLAQAISSSTDMNSFPVAALLVSSPGETEEFLLCYHEFAVFVNAKGRRTREDDLQWSRLPLSVSYREPYLYITHFNCLEVLEVKPIAERDGPRAHTMIELPNPRFTGFARTEGAVYVTSIHSQKAELICLKGNLVDNSSGQQNISNMDDTPRSSISSVARGDSRISLKRTLDESTGASSSKMSRTSSQSSHQDSFRMAISSSNPLGQRQSQTFTTASSSSEEEVSCGSVKMMTRATKGSHKSKQTKH